MRTIFYDTFLGTAGTALAGHAPDTQNLTDVWANLSGVGTLVFAVGGGVTSTGTGAWLAQYPSTSAPHDGKWTFVFKNSGSATSPYFQIERDTPGSNDLAFTVDYGAQQIVLTPTVGGVNGTSVNFATTLVTGTTYTLVLTFTGTSLTGTLNGTSVLTQTITSGGTGTVVLIGQVNGAAGNVVHLSAKQEAAISGATLSGPTTGSTGTPSSFTVTLNGTADADTTVTLIDSTGGNAFSGTHVSGTTLTILSGTSSGTFGYQRTTNGTSSISITSSGLTISGSPISYTSSSSAATAFTLSGPSTGTVGSPSTAFTFQPNGVYSGTLTPTMTGLAGTWSPTTLTWSSASNAQTATFTASAAGTGTANATSSPSLTAPASVSYTASSGMGSFAINDSHLFFSPYSVRVASSSLAVANGPHGYLKVAFTGTSLAIPLNASYTCPRMAVSVDGGAWTYPAPSGNVLTVATGLASGSHDALVVFDARDLTNSGNDSWVTPSYAFAPTGITLDAGASLATVTPRSLRAIIRGDSIGEGAAAALASSSPPGFYATDNSAHTAFPYLLASAIGAEYGGLCWASAGYTLGGNNGVPELDGSWNLYSSGQSRLVNGLYSPVPDLVFDTNGQNDSAASDATVTAKVSAMYANDRGAAALAVLIRRVPLSGNKRSAILAGLNAYANGHTVSTLGQTTIYQGVNDTKAYLIDHGVREEVGVGKRWISPPGDTYGIHPGAEGHAEIAALDAGAIRSILSGGSSSEISLGFDSGVVSDAPTPPTATDFWATGAGLLGASGDYTGMSVLFQTKGKPARSRRISAHTVVAGVHHFTLTWAGFPALTSAPAIGDSFEVVP